MENPFPFLIRLTLAVFLTMYGSFGIANMNAHHEAFLQEICANGTSKLVQVDADGQPVEQSLNCPNCLTCCNLISAPPHTAAGGLASFEYAEIETLRPTYENSVFQNRNILPAPRGPPDVHLTSPTQSKLIWHDQRYSDYKQRSDGRLPLKDARA